MNTTDANRTLSGYELTDELARFCLPEANRDPNRKLAWMNSICILFLLVGILGVNPATIGVRAVPPVEEVIPVIVEPTPPPPQIISAQDQNERQNDQEKSEAPQVVVVTPESPSINFSVPTIGTLVVPNAIAAAPPLRPLEARVMEPVRIQPAAPAQLGNTGTGGERPQPPYPKIALDQGEQGTVILLMSADEAGNVVSVEVKQSSGFPILDRSTLDYIKRHWTLPAGSGIRRFETSITYRLQAG